jgi:hypothetical protein
MRTLESKTLGKTLGLNRLLTASLATAGLLIGLALTSLAPTPAAAQEKTPEQACSSDAFRLCNEFIPDRTKVGACLKRNVRGLSADCRTFFVGGGRHVAGVRTHVRVRVYHQYRRHN